MPIPVTPRFKRLLETANTVLDRLSRLEKYIDERSSIYHGIKQGIVSSEKAMSGELHMYKLNEDGEVILNPEYFEGAMATAGLGMTGGIPGGASSPGELGVITRPNIVKPVSNPEVQAKINRAKAFVEQNPDRWHDTFVHDPDTGYNHFFDVRGEHLVEVPDVVEGVGSIGTNSNNLYSSYKLGVPHPDKDVQDMLQMTKLYVNPGAGSTHYDSSLGSISVEAAKKPFLKNKGLPTKYKRKNLESAFNISYVAHEANHAMQHISGLPQGGSPRGNAKIIFEETIGKDPQKLAEYEHAYQLANNWLAQDPLTLMVAITKMSTNKTTYQKYVDMLYPQAGGDATNKFFKVVEVKDKLGKVEGVRFEPKVEKILNEVIRDSLNGHINLEGTALEPWMQLNRDAFSAYKHMYGEAYSRVEQTRAFKARSGKDKDIYRTNPNSNLDVDPEKITFPKELKKLEDLPDDFVISDNGKALEVYTKDGDLIQGYIYTSKQEYEEANWWLIEDMNKFLGKKRETVTRSTMNNPPAKRAKKTNKPPEIKI